jgi:signal transduction histidine kinase
MPQPFRSEEAIRNDWYLDASLAAMGLIVVHVPFIVGVLMLDQAIGLTAGVAMAVLGMIPFLAIVARRHYPSLFFGAVIVACLAQVVVLPYPSIGWIVAPLAVYEVARRMRPGRARLYLTVALVVFLAGAARWIWLYSDRANLRTVMVFFAISGVGALATTYSVGRRGYDVALARARQDHAEQEAAHLTIAEQTARQHYLETQVRASIARELHDIVAHSISVMTVQAEGGLAQAKYSPEPVRQALSTISETGREALQEMRRIVRTLRSDRDVAVELASAPGIADIPALIDKAQATLTIQGEPHGLTPSGELTIYRVIQEALTNSLKHAGPQGEPHVVLQWQPERVSVTITNRAGSHPVVTDNRGSGLIGMAERVEALEGRLSVGPSETGGFRVCAQIPLRNGHRDR